MSYRLQLRGVGSACGRHRKIPPHVRKNQLVLRVLVNSPREREEKSGYEATLLAAMSKSEDCESPQATQVNRARVGNKHLKLF